MTIADSLNKLRHFVKGNRFIDPMSLYFGQQKASTQDLLGKDYHTLPLYKIPHYKFLAGQKSAYAEYLKNSWKYDWPENNTEKSRKNQEKEYKALVEDIKTRGVSHPIIICTRFDGKNIIIDGNHRAAIAAHLGKPLPYKKKTIEEHLRKITRNPKERYGTQLKAKPYQSIFYKGTEVLIGRRRDVIKRAALIRDEDLKNKTVLDLGCNLGMSSFNAAERGAKTVYGYDVSHKLLMAATRINALFGLPCYFYHADLSKRIDTPRCDTAFVFSIDQHVGNDKMLAQNIKRNVKSVVYFECHTKTEIPADIKKIFKEVVLVGETFGSKRNMFRCIL